VEGLRTESANTKLKDASRPARVSGMLVFGTAWGVGDVSFCQLATAERCFNVATSVGLLIPDTHLADEPL